MTTDQVNNLKKADTAHDIMPELSERWSPRAFSQEDIPQEAIHQLFEAARWAASSRNRQPWRFIYARRGTAAWDKMMDCLAEFNRQWVKNAPLLIFTAYQEKWDNGKDNFHALHDLGLAMGNMSAQAQHMGLAMHHMAGIDWQKAQEVFDVPEGYHITTAVAVGYYGGDVEEQLPEDLQEGETKPRTRNPQSEWVGEGQWPS